MKQKQVKESRRKNKNKEKPLVQSYPQSDTIYLQTAQALGPCTPSDAIIKQPNPVYQLPTPSASIPKF